MAPKLKTLYIFPAFILAIGAVLLNGCGGSGGSSTVSTLTAATPTFSPAGGTYTTAQTVTISDSTSGATIYYTTDGTTPTTASSVYSSAISIPATTATTETIEAIAVASGYTNSAVASAVYKMTPTTATATVVGADVGWLTQLETLGYTWEDTSGTAGSALQILKTAGVNTIRIRTFVNPTITSTSLGVGDLDQAGSIALAKTASGMGFKIMIDFHYSDTWADPDHQTTPAAWTNDTYAELKTDVYNYTYSFMTALVAAGVTPDYVQVGNEINTGMLWPLGEVGSTTTNGNNFTNIIGLINEGYSAVKTVSPTTQVVIHIAGISTSSDLSDLEWFFDGLEGTSSSTVSANYDVIGVSYYDTVSTLTTVASNLKTMAARYSKPVLICEIGYKYNDPTDGYADVQGAIEAMNAVPSNMGLGVIYWEPEAPDDASTDNYTLGAVTESTGQVLQFTSVIDAF
jgi:arabinogalactan endo-1,4-beta-galactosidase